MPDLLLGAADCLGKLERFFVWAANEVVRESFEVAIASIPNTVHIPLGEVVNRMAEIDPSRETVVHCKGGVRSARAIEALKRSGFTGNLINLRGGIMAWSNDVDPTVPKY